MIRPSANHRLKTRQSGGQRGIARYALWSGIALLLFCIVLALVSDHLLNTFVKDEIIAGVEWTDPAYRLQLGRLDFDILANRLSCDSIVLTTTDSAFLLTTGPGSLEGMNWIAIFNGEPLDGALLNARSVFAAFGESGYELKCESLFASVPDSLMTFQALSLSPTGGDERFFDASTFRRDRFLVHVQDGEITGVPCLGIFTNTYQADAIHLNNASIDILINKNKPSKVDSSKPLMPQEALLALENKVVIDSATLTNTRLTYGELFSHSSTPAFLTWDSVQATATNISNQRRGDTMSVDARGIFMEEGLMTLSVVIPIRAPDASFRYSGFLTSMPLVALNPFLEIADQIRLKSGMLQRADFSVDVKNGRATGAVWAQYEDLTIAALDKRTRSENGLAEQLATVISNLVQIRGTNMPDDSGSVTIGRIRYPARKDLEFLQILWFALRNGLGDVVGFSA